jgi:hypothetical protein
MNRKIVGWAALTALFIIGAVWLATDGWRDYAIRQIESAMRAGIYASPEEGMRELIADSYTGIERIEIDYAGTNSFDGRSPQIWFVTARVYAAARGDGKAIREGEFDLPGSYFLHVNDGWVLMPEGAFPELVGRAMERFELYGCDKEKHNCNS